MNKIIKESFKKNITVRKIYSLLQILRTFFSFRPLLLCKQLLWFFNELKRYKLNPENENFKKMEWYPCLTDKLVSTPLEPTYFFQDSWAAKQIFRLKPKSHVDVGSSAKTIGILSQYVPITMVDIRPIELKLENLNFLEGSILDLPFEDNSIETLSSLCVIEHIGLGRYGDPIDSFGSEKAIKELNRVLKINGIIIFSVPVDSENKIYFNAHRAFTRAYIFGLFHGYEILEERYHYGTKMYDEYDPLKGFGTGLFMMKKIK